MFRKIFVIIQCLITAILWANHAGATDPAFPRWGIDTHSLGRGGTVTAAPGGVSSVFGNPATLTPEGRFYLGGEYLRNRLPSEKTWSVHIVDTGSTIRGGAVYINNPAFTGFEDDLWGVAFSQTLGASLIIGESYHSGDYRTTAGGTETLSAADLGLLFFLGPNIALGYISRNAYTSDDDLLDKASGYGISIGLPWAIVLSVDYEDNPTIGGENDFRGGVVFSPIPAFTGRLGYMELGGDYNLYTAGATYRDRNGTLDLGVSYDPETERMERIIFGMSIHM